MKPASARRPAPWLTAGWPLVLVLVLEACGVREEGLTIEVRASIAPLPSRVELADGGSTSVTEATLRLSSVELTACPSLAATAWRWLSPIGTGWAHGVRPGEGPLVLAIGAPIELTTPGTQALGTLRPPPGRYCRLVARLGATDPDGGALPTLRLSGTGALTLATDEARPLTLDFDALLVDQTASSASLLLELDLGRALAGVDPSSARAAGQCLSQLARDASVRPGP